MFDPIISLLQQGFDRGRAVIASDRFVQAPPDPFDGISFGGSRGQKVQANAVPPYCRVMKWMHLKA